MKIIQGDCLEKLKLLESNSIDGCVTDPPAGISMMGKEWDSNKGGRDQWMQWMQEVFTEVLRVLKPGGHCLVWSIPRTSHWTAMSLENSGFEIRDCVYHIFGSGFPKSHNVSKGIDKKFGAKRLVVRKRKDRVMDFKRRQPGIGGFFDPLITSQPSIQIEDTISSTPEAKKYDGYGSQLKPAVECWWLIRKPLKGSIVDNVLKYGTGGLNIDKSRVPTEDKMQRSPNPDNSFYGNINDYRKDEWKQNDIGRFPANLIHDGSDEVMKEFEKYGSRKGNKPGAIRKGSFTFCSNYETNVTPRTGFNDTGSPAKFFYCSKPSIAERNLGCDDIEAQIQNLTTGKGRTYNDRCLNCGKKFNGSPNTICHCDNPQTDKSVYKNKNNHPTIKSVKLMSYLVNLIMPPTGVVIDPFMGSGSTGIAALLNGYDFIGIEQDISYIDIAKARLDKFEDYRRFLK